MNRAERRRAAKAAPKKPSWHKLTTEERKEKLFRNGITTSDLEHNYELGRKQGIKDTVDFYEPMFYSAMAIALHELYGLGANRLSRAFIRTREIFDSECFVPELSDRAYKETKLRITTEGWDY